MVHPPIRRLESRIDNHDLGHQIPILLEDSPRECALETPRSSPKAGRRRQGKNGRSRNPGQAGNAPAVAAEATSLTRLRPAAAVYPSDGLVRSILRTAARSFDVDRLAEPPVAGSIGPAKLASFVLHGLPFFARSLFRIMPYDSPRGLRSAPSGGLASDLLLSGCGPMRGACGGTTKARRALAGGKTSSKLPKNRPGRGSPRRPYSKVGTNSGIRSRNPGENSVWKGRSESVKPSWRFLSEWGGDLLVAVREVRSGLWGRGRFAAGGDRDQGAAGSPRVATAIRARPVPE